MWQDVALVVQVGLTQAGTLKLNARQAHDSHQTILAHYCKRNVFRNYDGPD